MALEFLAYQVQKSVLDASFTYTVVKMETVQLDSGHVGFSTLL